LISQSRREKSGSFIKMLTKGTTLKRLTIKRWPFRADLRQAFDETEGWEIEQQGSAVESYLQEMLPHRSCD
jgi:hypothetical protein